MNRNLLTSACLITALSLTGCRSTDGLAEKSPFTPTSDSDEAMQFNVAQVREREGKFKQALEIYENLVTADPDNAQYRHRYGVTLCEQGEYEKGIEELKLADAQKPDDPEILNDLGYAMMVTGELNVAREVLRATLELDRKNERAINNLAMVHGYLGDFDEAYQLFSRVMTEPEALANLGYVATNVGNREFAISCFSRALDLDADLMQAKEALVQLADLDRQIEDRMAIAQASARKSPAAAGSAIIHAGSAEQAEPSRPNVQHASGNR